MSKQIKTVLGALYKYYSDNKIHEILIDSYSESYVVFKSEMKDVKIFKSEAELKKIIDNLIKFSGIKKSDNQYNYFVRLDDFSFCHIVLPPLAIKGPSLTLMKLPKNEISLDDLVKFNAVDEEGKKILLGITQSNKGFLVSGNVGSGKITLLNILINLLPESQRLVTFERTPDLIIKRKYVCRLHMINEQPEEIRKLMRLGNYLRADYAIMNDVFLDEVSMFIDLVRNNCTGVMLLNGMSALDSLKNLETKIVLSSNGNTFEEARYNIANSFPYIIHQEKDSNGLRKIVNISSIEYKNGELVLKNLYKR